MHLPLCGKQSWQKCRVPLLLASLCLFAFSFAASSQAQDASQPNQQPDRKLHAAPPPHTSSVTGAVKTVEGTPVPGATVKLSDSASGKSWQSWTDESGNFIFPQIPDGLYKIETSQIGFTPSSIEMKVPVVPAEPIPVELRVATLAELAPKPEAAAPANDNRPHRNNGNTQANKKADVGAPAGNSTANGAGGRRGQGGGQVPAGVANALNAGIASTDFSKPISPAKVLPACKTNPRQATLTSLPRRISPPVRMPETPAPIPF